jgi:hypothetical protein
MPLPGLGGGYWLHFWGLTRYEDKVANQETRIGWREDI